MYLSTTQILKRLGIERNKKNADYIRKYFDGDWINISNTDRIPVELYGEHSDWLIETYQAKEWHPKTFPECQINSVTNFETAILNQDKRILDLQSEIAILNNKLLIATDKIEKIISVFRNFNKGE
jgi:hypothetical protein